MPIFYLPLPGLPSHYPTRRLAPRPRPPGRLALAGGAVAALALASALVVGLVGGRS